MSRFILAFACFFKLLFTGKLPVSAAERLPEEALPKLLEARGKADETGARAEKAKPEKKNADAEKEARAEEAAKAEKQARAKAARQEAKAERKSVAAHHE